MMKFDNAKYRTVLNLIKKTGEFKGKAVPSKARLHEMIGDALGISHNTVKDWERATSNGPDPRIPGLLEQLEGSASELGAEGRCDGCNRECEGGCRAADERNG